MSNLRAILAEEGLTKEAGKGVPKGKLTISGSPYNFRRFQSQEWKNVTLRDFTRIEKLVDEGYEMFGDDDAPELRHLEGDIKALEEELAEKKKEHAKVKRMADALQKEGIDPASLYGGYSFWATDEDGNEWEHQPDGWYLNNP